jgi:hypothetical protein
MSTADISQAIIFVHMFKSGGNTLNRIMDREYPPTRIFSVNGRYRYWAYRKLSEYPPAGLAKIQVFRGHMPFGLHRIIPQPSTYITVLRNPVERIISEYVFGVNYRFHRQHRIISKMSLEEFLETLANNNSQTKMIAGFDSSSDLLSLPCGADTLELAKANLRNHFSLVGLSERFTETLALARRKFGWRVPAYASCNATPGRKRAVVSARLREVIADRNSFDMELYKYARELFEEDIARNYQEIAAFLEEVKRAQLDRGWETVRYSAGSTALKLFTLALSTVRSVRVLH